MPRCRRQPWPPPEAAAGARRPGSAPAARRGRRTAGPGPPPGPRSGRHRASRPRGGPCTPVTATRPPGRRRWQATGERRQQRRMDVDDPPGKAPELGPRIRRKPASTIASGAAAARLGGQRQIVTAWNEGHRDGLGGRPIQRRARPVGEDEADPPAQFATASGGDERPQVGARAGDADRHDLEPLNHGWHRSRRQVRHTEHHRGRRPGPPRR